MEPSNYTNYQQPDLNSRRLLIIKLGFVAVLLIIILVIVNYFLSQKTLTIEPTAGYTISIGTPGNGENGPTVKKTIAKTSSTKSIRLKPGNYVALYAKNSDYQPIYQEFDLTKNITLNPPTLYYTSQKLASLLKQESPAIHAAFQASGSGSLLANGYSIQDIGLYYDGSWYAGKLVPADTTTSDVLAFVMHQDDGKWTLATTPAISLYAGSYSTIPKTVIQSANNTPATQVSTPGSTAPTTVPQLPQGVLSTADNYIQAREDSVGEDQASESSWFATIQPDTTAAFLAELQQDGEINNGDYITAHNDGFTVKADVSGCTWSLTDSTSGTLSCSLTDQTISAASGTEADPVTIPFGWTHNGQQPAVILNFVDQNNVWLISGDTTYS
jgi:hypothetical protein